MSEDFELELVEKRYAGKKGFTWFVLKLAGNAPATGPYDYIFNDGYVFRPYAKGISGDAFLESLGCTDPSGAKFQKYVDAAGLGFRADGTKLPDGHYVNWLELDPNRTKDISF